MRKLHSQHFETETEFIEQIKKAYADIEEREDRSYFPWDVTLQTLVFVKTLVPVYTVKPEAKFWTKYTYGKLNNTDDTSNHESSFPVNSCI